MIWSNPCLERVIERENLVEILGLLLPSELCVAALRADGMDDAEIAEALGICRQAVSQRLQAAHKRILAARPELAPLLQGRTRRGSHKALLGTAGPAESMTVADTAEMLGLNAESVRHRLRRGCYAGATIDERGRWSIPIDAVYQE